MFPDIAADDVVMFGSYFALNPVLRPKVAEFLDYARGRGALIYYDVNFRSTHATDAIKLTPTILENFETADIVRGSTEDFRNMFGLSDPARVYADKVKFYCPRLLCTAGAGAVSLHSERVVKDYPVEPVETVSTVGAGDNFNAGIVYGLLKYDVRRDDLPGLTEADWDAIVRCGLDFSAEACRNLGNSGSPEFAERYKKMKNEE